MPGEERPRAPSSSTVYFVDVVFAVKATSLVKAQKKLAHRLREGAAVKVRRNKFSGKSRTNWRAIRHERGEGADAG